jgi:uncharacterized membrane protein YbhN (UPF0104 family)
MPVRDPHAHELRRTPPAARRPDIACSVPAAPPAPEPADAGLRLSGRRAVILLGAGILGTVSVVLLLPALADIPDVWAKLGHGDVRWLALAFAFEVVSFAGHILLFRAVGRDRRGRVGMRESTEITLAGHAATRLFASAGAGGVALTAWALRRSGLERGEVAARMTTFIVLLYGVYMGALVIGGLGLYAGILPGDGPASMTLVPAGLGAVVIVTALTLPRLSQRTGRGAALGEGVRGALRLTRRLDPGLIGAGLWWAADIAVLWACFAAFGHAPAVTIVVVAYFVGMLANTLPLPGGVGGVDGGMVAAFAAFGVDPGLALVSVLAYRAFSFWLPILPGVAAWVSLRRTVAGWEREDAPGEAPARVAVLRRPAITASRQTALAA